MSTSTAPSYVFKYFALSGLGETSRLLLTMANVEWIEENPEWPQEKSSQPFGRLPVLIEKNPDGDFVLSESGTIERYLARKYKLIPEDLKEAARQEQLRDQMCDVITNYFIAKTGEKEAKTRHDELIKKLKEVLANALKNNGSNGRFLGDKLTYIDLYIYSFFKFLIPHTKTDAPQLADDFVGLITPDVAKLIATVREEPRLQACLAEDNKHFSFLN
ncbi:hypothetical protein GGI25_005487 [Coemansia spiralis]|uniref:Glutathione S-transferase n=2 Tax=Coemansia TaxID=4863 RepID=A0A9W8KW71_9FUNG|nr:hypothetical protein EDC05_005479 [Coemansia umbellata]KAJ2619496.1 hypothetical protein GGI26_005797 [Coemansia sp. RSA 1358]KAJ2671473.1 hypothetical protein GGI25_005487 [Coemansia spiralis]